MRSTRALVVARAERRKGEKREEEQEEDEGKEEKGKRERVRAPKEGDSQIFSARKNLITKFRGER